ncbi:MAG: ferritin-like domain-containing protein [Armatimonadetes bacterium]|nr:ferritin-like domain-containing protein [Armatimonadota bacterium]
MAKVTTLKELYVEQLQDLYSAEQQIIATLPKMMDAAQNAQLKQGFQMHLEQTQGHAQRLEQVLQNLGEKPGGVTCQAMQGLVKEAQETMKETEPGPVQDAALIADAQRVEHYEMAGYGTVITLAKQVGDTQAAGPLGQTLQEEKQTDEKLTQVAESMVNPQAAQQG